jgi:hypothetical protein
MKIKNIILSLCFGSVLFHPKAQTIDGITMVATPKPIDATAFERVKKTNAEWACFVPYAFQQKGQNNIKFDLEKQWWGETKDGIETCISLAHKQQMKVMLKPQIYLHGSWTGDIDFQKEEDWIQWEKSYSVYINAMLDIAVKNKVEMFCFGTELKIVSIKREKYMKELIKSIRAKYKGKLTYSANWDDYSSVPFWEELDFIGISAYFPLTDMKTPTPNTLDLKWKKVVKDLGGFSKKKGKKILFTEYGYLTTDHCAWKTWEVEAKVNTLNENQEAQSISFNALYKAMWSQPFFAGGFIWKWFPHGQGHEGYKNKDYDPQDKKAEEIVKKYYGIH